MVFHDYLGFPSLATHSNQIYLVMLTYGQLTQASFLQKKSKFAKSFFDISNAEIAQCRQNLEVNLVIKVF